MTDEIKLQKVGLKVEFQAAILDLQFAGIFETETLKFWIKDTLASRYHTIAYLQRRSTEGLESAPAVRIGAPAAALGDHYVLYQGRVAHTDEDTPLIAPDGAVDLTSIDTAAGGDFNARERASYWTPEAATAELYRGYAERRNAHAETWIVSIQVPKAFVATLRNVLLWYSADWKEYVWLCRKKAAQLPGKFDELSKAQVVYGHVCRKLPQMMARIKPENIQTIVDEYFCLPYKGPDGQTSKCI